MVRERTGPRDRWGERRVLPEERTGYRSGARPEPFVPRAGSDGPSGADPDDVVRCDLCGGPMIDRHCKLVCRVCGYQRDCSDP